jgi:hypothetical protein
MKNIWVIILIFFTSIMSWTDENYYGLTKMPWNTDPEKVVEVIGIPDVIMTDSNEIVWLNRNYFADRYNYFVERFGINTSKTINEIIVEQQDIQLIYYNKQVGRIYTTMTICFEHRFASCEKYSIDIDGLSINEKNNIYNLLKNEFLRQYGTPKSTSENNVFKTVRWEKYYTNIELQLYTNTYNTGSGDYLIFSYERTDVSRRQAGLGLDIVATDKIGDNINYNQFMNFIESVKRGYQERGIEVGDLVPNGRENDPLTIGLNHLLNTTSYSINELWSIKIYFENINTWVFIYILFNDRDISGYSLRGIILPNVGFNL